MLQMKAVGLSSIFYGMYKFFCMMSLFKKISEVWFVLHVKKRVKFDYEPELNSMDNFVLT
jgi:hypothetical protein